MAGGVRRVFVDGVTNGRVGNAVQFKSNKDRGAVIEDVLIRPATRAVICFGWVFFF